MQRTLTGLLPGVPVAPAAKRRYSLVRVVRDPTKPELDYWLGTLEARRAFIAGDLDLIEIYGKWEYWNRSQSL